MFSSNASQVSQDAVFIEDVFSTYLYTGNGSTQTINNGIDLAGEGGLVWIKDRVAPNGNVLQDTVRGFPANAMIQTNDTGVYARAFPSVTDSGFDLNFTDLNAGQVNTNSTIYVSWTFRKQPKFFDVVTWTGNGANRTIAHNLGSVPGCIIVKRTDASANWQVYHRSLANTQYLVLNSTAAAATGATRWNSTTPTDTVFSLGTDATVNASGGTYVAYLFAHNAGGFGLSGTDNVISCGSISGTDSLSNYNLGYEPQWLLIKPSSGTGDWTIYNNMSGWTASGGGLKLNPNTSGAETTFAGQSGPTATGFTFFGTTGVTYIYIAIRRGPMKVPTTGTSVFGLNARTGTGANATVTGGAGVTDLAIIKNRGTTNAFLWASRMTGTGYLNSVTTNAEVAAPTTVLQANPWDVMDGVKVGTTSAITNASANTFINYLFDRAPGAFDVVCYTGTGVARTVAHNLTVVPELMIVKSRSDSSQWNVYSAATGASSFLILNSTVPSAATSDAWNSTEPTSSVFTVGVSSNTNGAGRTFVAYLFASCPGVSKVFNYTGNGSSQTINCGFTGGARFVMIKRTDATANWYVWDSARGIVAGNDPRLEFNTGEAEVTSQDTVDTDSTGFVVNQLVGTNINVSSATYIGLAIA